MSDIVERLHKFDTKKYDAVGICEEAADEIDRLRAVQAEQIVVLEAILESVEDNDMFSVGQYVTAALKRAKE